MSIGADDSLSPEQRKVLSGLAGVVQRYETLQQSRRGNARATDRGAYSATHWLEQAEEESDADLFPQRSAKLEDEIRGYVKQAIKLGLGDHPTVQTAAAKYEIG